MTTNAVAASAFIIFIYLLVHCAFLHYTFRNMLLCLDKYSSLTFYGIRTALNIIYVLADVSVLTALGMTFQNGFNKIPKQLDPRPMLLRE
ncbi:hypothetical protein MTO96_014961 [Rhipicephalus appendiculatus]